eukprot:657159-Hanusia_phi.AAC.1
MESVLCSSCTERSRRRKKQSPASSSLPRSLTSGGSRVHLLDERQEPLARPPVPLLVHVHVVRMPPPPRRLEHVDPARPPPQLRRVVQHFPHCQIPSPRLLHLLRKEVGGRSRVGQPQDVRALGKEEEEVPLHVVEKQR